MIECAAVCLLGVHQKWLLRPAAPPIMLIGGDIFGLQVRNACGRLIPGLTGNSVCGISHVSTVVTQSSAGSKTIDLSQALSHLILHLLLLSAVKNKCSPPGF